MSSAPSPVSNPEAAPKGAPTAWCDLIALAAAEVFDIMVGAKITSARCDRQKQQGVTAMLGFAGVPCGVFSVRCSWMAATAIAARMLGAEPSTLPVEQVCDAMGEICNVVAGSLKTRLSDAGAGCMISIPTVVRGVDYEVRCLACDSSFSVSMEFEGEGVLFDLELQSS